MAALIKRVNGRVVGVVNPTTGPTRVGRIDLAPADVEAERALLGGLLIEPSMMFRVGRIVAREHFFRPPHADIFEAIITLYRQGIEADNVTVRGELERLGILEECGGAPYLTQLLEAVPHATHAVHYASIVRRRATDRALIQAAGEMARSAYDGEEDALAQAKAILHRLDTDFENAESGDIDDALAGLMAPRPAGWSTGLGVVDGWLGGVGLAPARSLVITGQSGAGKTLLATSMAVSAMEAGARVAFFTLEMSKVEMLTRIGAHLFGGRAYRLLQVPSHQWTDFDRVTFGEIAQWCEDKRSRGLFKLYQDQYDVFDIVARARVDGADVVILDWYQQLRFKRSRGQTADEVDQEQSGALIGLAKSAGACVVVVSQLNARGEAKYGAWLNSHCHARLHIENIDGSQTRVKISPLKNRWGGDSASGAHAEFEAQKAVGRFRPVYQGDFA